MYQKVIVDGLEQDDVTKDVTIACDVLLGNLTHFVIADAAQYKVEKVKLYKILFDIDMKVLSVLGLDSKGNTLTIRSEIELFSTGEEVKLKMQEDLGLDIDGQLDMFDQDIVKMGGEGEGE